MTETNILKHPCGHNCVYSKENLIFFASKVFESLQESSGDMTQWWTHEYKGRNYWVDNDNFLIKEGNPHFWKRVEVIDLTNDTDEDDEIIDLTEDEN